MIRIGNKVKFKKLHAGEWYEFCDNKYLIYIDNEIAERLSGKTCTITAIKNIEGTEFFQVKELEGDYWCTPTLVDFVYDEINSCVLCDKKQDTYHFVNGYKLCDTCFNNKVHTCSVSGKQLIEGIDSVYYVNADTCICEEVYLDKYVTNALDDYCIEKECAGAVHNSNKEVYYPISWLESNGYQQCHDCGYYELADNMICLNERYFCVDCFNDMAYNTVKCYHYYKNWTMRSLGTETQKNELPIGFELEVENRGNRVSNDGMAYLIKNINEGLTVAEHDGSLNNGFEIISHPMTLGFLRSKENLFREIFDKLRANDFRSHDTDTCGLHIHVSRDYLKTDRRSEEEIIDNIILIVETFKEPIQTFARRWSNSYAYFLTDNLSNNAINKISVKKKYKEADRYAAISTCTSDNADTIEFRMFRGTLRFETFMASVELINNIINIAKYEDIDGLTWDKIIAYNSDNNKYLDDYCISREIKDNGISLVFLPYYTTHLDEYNLEGFLAGKFGLILDSETAENNDAFLMSCMNVGTLISILEVNYWDTTCYIADNLNNCYSLEDSLTDAILKFQNNRLVVRKTGCGNIDIPIEVFLRLVEVKKEGGSVECVL